MRGIRMSTRSVYARKKCLHCHKVVRQGEAAVVSTFYVCPRYPDVVTTQAQNYWIQHNRRVWPYGSSGVHHAGPQPLSPPESDEFEMEVRVVYHRRCVEKILRKAPVDPEVEAAEFEEYRSGLLERYGVEE